MQLVLPTCPAARVLAFLTNMTVFLFKMMQYNLPLKLNLLYYPVHAKPFIPFVSALYLCPHAIKRIVSKSSCF